MLGISLSQLQNFRLNVGSTLTHKLKNNRIMLTKSEHIHRQVDKLRVGNLFAR